MRLGVFKAGHWCRGPSFSEESLLDHQSSCLIVPWYYLPRWLWPLEQLLKRTRRKLLMKPKRDWRTWASSTTWIKSERTRQHSWWFMDNSCFRTSFRCGMFFPDPKNPDGLPVSPLLVFNSSWPAEECGSSPDYERYGTFCRNLVTSRWYLKHLFLFLILIS